MNSDWNLNMSGRSGICCCRVQHAPCECGELVPERLWSNHRCFTAGLDAHSHYDVLALQVESYACSRRCIVKRRLGGFERVTVPPAIVLEQIRLTSFRERKLHLEVIAWVCLEPLAPGFPEAVQIERRIAHERLV